MLTSAWRGAFDPRHGLLHVQRQEPYCDAGADFFDRLQPENTARRLLKRLEGVESIFSSLPKPQEWRSFYNHDLPLITTIDPDVKQVAIEEKLNKSQVKELGGNNGTMAAE